MHQFYIIVQYFRYRFKAKSAHGIHSPFVYEFITTVLQDHRHYYAFDQIRALRNQLLENSTELNVEDFGAGSVLGNFKKRMVKNIAKNAGRNEKFGKLLFRIIDKYQSKRILELGTSLGIGTSYLAEANRQAEVITIEGSREIAQMATNNFLSLDLKNIQQVTGNFDDVLKEVLENHAAFDLIFIDGNHREEATIRYFNQFLPFISEQSILIFDDIHWSKGMSAAWESIRQDNRVRLSIDLFFFGLVFFKKEFKEKQHFILKY